MSKYIIKYTTINGKKGFHEFTTFKSAKEIYLAIQENLTIKKARLYKAKDNKKMLLEKFTKKRIVGLNETGVK